MASQPDHHTKYRLVLLEKIATAPNSVTSPGSWYQWENGSPENHDSPPIDYILIGYLRTPIQIGNPIILVRTHRNGVERLGYFRSTPVVQFRGDQLVETFNSIYRITETVMSDKEMQ